MNAKMIISFFLKRKERKPIPCTEMAVPGRESVVFDDGIRKVFKCFSETVGELKVTPDGYFIDRDGIISGRA